MMLNVSNAIGTTRVSKQVSSSAIVAMAQDAKVRKRSAPADAKAESQEDAGSQGLRIGGDCGGRPKNGCTEAESNRPRVDWLPVPWPGRFKINLGRLPELLLLFVIAGMVAQIAMINLEMSRQMAVISGLGVAVQLQRMGNWLREWVAYKN
eukprot:Skav232425  [mRNA]  locus=scaffold189:116375:116827:- [translate_table: standard]